MFAFLPSVAIELGWMNYILEKLSLYRKELLNDMWLELNDLLFPCKKVFFWWLFFECNIKYLNFYVTFEHLILTIRFDRRFYWGIKNIPMMVNFRFTSLVYVVLENIFFLKQCQDEKVFQIAFRDRESPQWRDW